MFLTKKLTLPAPEEALPGRDAPMAVPEAHFVNGNPLKPPFPEGFETAMFGFGCFWGAEKIFWEVDGVHTTAVGYAGGSTPNPTYQEVCSGRTGHNEVVFVVYDPSGEGRSKIYANYGRFFAKIPNDLAARAFGTWERPDSRTFGWPQRLPE